MSDSTASHRRDAATLAGERPIPCAVLTVSDTRTIETDESGALVVRLLEERAHRVVERDLVPDEPDAIRRRLLGWLGNPDVSVIISTGGTGVGRRDTTVEVVRALLTTELEGFGELFRMLSFEEIGAAAMLSRAVGGLVAQAREGGGDTIVFALPGSRNAVETAMTRLIVPELPHVVWERRG